jgi:ubiquinol-cytochrome c reductase cytochrome b subunit
MLHVLLVPLAIMGLIVLHFGTLRLPHVNNQDGEEIDFEEAAALWKAGRKAESKVIPFKPVFLSKDVFVMGIYFIFFFYLVFYHFEFAMDPVNFDPADPLKTPAHIYPEWYFLWSYEILRPFSKDIGLIWFGFAQVIFVALPFLDRSPNVAPANRRRPFRCWFWLLLIDMVILTIMGKLPPTDPTFAIIGKIAAYTFIILWVVLPFITMKEKLVGGKK